MRSSGQPPENLVDDCLGSSESPFPSACRARFSPAPIHLSRWSSLRGYIDQGETQSVCSVTGVRVRRVRSTLICRRTKICAQLISIGNRLPSRSDEASLLIPQTASTYSRHALPDGLPMACRMLPNDYSDYRDDSGAAHGQINSNLGSEGPPERRNRPAR